MYDLAASNEVVGIQEAEYRRQEEHLAQLTVGK